MNPLINNQVSYITKTNYDSSISEEELLACYKAINDTVLNPDYQGKIISFDTFNVVYNSVTDPLDANFKLPKFANEISIPLQRAIKVLICAHILKVNNFNPEIIGNLETKLESNAYLTNPSVVEILLSCKLAIS